MGLFYRTHKGQTIDFTLELKGDWYSDIRQETRSRFLAPEWCAQSGIEIIWPDENTDWAYMLDEITGFYLRLTFEIASRERLLIVTSHAAHVRQLLSTHMSQRVLRNIRIFECEINDTWARDTGFLTVSAPGGAELLDFRFNGWGGKFEAAKDNAINKHIFDAGLLKGTYIDCNDFILEGGSIETDSEGTLLTTESCLLAPTRNRLLNKTDIEAKLKHLFNVSNILWLSHGHLVGDDTDGHIDTLARLCPGGKIAYVKCHNQRDEHFKELELMEQELCTFTQPSGEPYELLPLPLPDPVNAPADGVTAGERLPATYANYLVMNNAILMPAYDQPANDAHAAKVIAQAFPRHEIVSVPCRALLRQHGSLHCSTMQYSAGTFKLWNEENNRNKSISD